jgi:hypothetical protein
MTTIKNPNDLVKLINKIKDADYPNDRILPKVEVIFQEGTIKENGVNGVQFTALLQIALEILKKLNSAHPCCENALTITKIEEALMWQDARTKDRIERGVEGNYEN